MKPSLSLRSRVLLGAFLWTVGLFVLASILLIRVTAIHPQAPAVVHGAFDAGGLPVLLAALSCMVAGLLQVRSGLSGVQQLRRHLAALHAGREGRLLGTYPSEVQPLADDLNALLDQRDRAIARALAKAGDLAHGLKTPLAVLAHEGERLAAAGHAEPAQSVHQQVERMRRHVHYHLAHARVAAAGTHGARCSVRESADALARALARLHAERRLTIDVRAPESVMVRARRADLDEMLGNLLDNACRAARAGVIVDATVASPSVVITVDDDGAGLPSEMRDAVLARGVRADESGPGFGLGLAIVRDLADLHGGAIRLVESPGGGLRAELSLPAA